jgi:putative DNA primase/helicase
VIDFQGIAARLLADARNLVPGWLPGGKFQGHEYICGSIAGGTGGSFSVNVMTGRWGEFAGEDKGGDLISLYAAIHNLSNGAAAQELEPAVAGIVPKYVNGHDAEPDHVQRPPNVDFQASMFKHSHDGLPSQFWIYRDAEGPLMAVARYDKPDQKKEIRPWTFNGLKWICKGVKAPRPLYGLDRLAQFDQMPVLLVEGEKTADAAQHYFPTRPCMSWQGGVGQVGQADWSALQGRQVTIWPDNDKPGINAAAKICEKLLALDCTVSIIDPTGWEEAWDIADALAAGTPKSQLIEYAKAHTKPVERPDDKTAPTGPTRVQSLPPAGSQTYEQGTGGTSQVQMWEQYGFVRKATGRPYCNQHNVMCALEARQGADLYFDEFAQRIFAGDREWTDAANIQLTVWLQKAVGMSEVNPRVVLEGVQAYAATHRKNPLAGWLTSLVWDQTPRLLDLLPLGMGAVRSEYIEQVGRCFMIGMVARVLEPGCKLDCMPVFEGAQGVGKSTALKILGGKYFAEIHESITSKDFYIAISGKMLCEISELHAFKRAEIERIKGIITTATDRFRAPYDRTAADHPRACVFAGTTNLDDWNTDETGARRFWPVRCGDIDGDWLRDHRGQLFAEAVARYNKGEDWWRIPEEAADIQRAARRDVDPWEELMRGHMNANLVIGIPYVIDQILKLKPSEITNMTQKRIGKILRQNGYENRVRRDGDAITRRWVKN